MEPEVRAMSAFARFDRMVKTPDEELAARCREGDVSAFAEVYARCERPVFRYAFHLLGCRDDADDAKQETFVRAWQSMRLFKGECALQIWLLRICANVCRDRLKARRRRPEVPLEPSRADYDQSGVADDPEAEITRRIEQAALWAAVRSMPVAHRAIIVLREIEGLSYAEVAAALGCTIASVKVRLFRARRILRQRVVGILEERD